MLQKRVNNDIYNKYCLIHNTNDNETPYESCVGRVKDRSYDQIVQVILSIWPPRP